MSKPTMALREAERAAEQSGLRSLSGASADCVRFLAVAAEAYRWCGEMEGDYPDLARALRRRLYAAEDRVKARHADAKRVARP
jgi:hypothetical protein